MIELNALRMHRGMGARWRHPMSVPTRVVTAQALSLWRRTVPRGRRGPADRRSDTERVRALVHEAAREPHVIIVTERAAKWTTQRWLRTFYGDHVTILSPPGFRPSHLNQPHVTVEQCSDPRAVTVLLRDRPAPDLVLDLRADQRARTAMWQAILPHVPQGACVIFPAPERDDLTPPSPSATEPVGGIGDYVLFRAAKRHYLRVADRDLARLAVRAPGLHVATMHTLPPREVISRTTVIHHAGAAQHVDFDEVMQTPELTLRHYRGPLRVVSQLATLHDHVMLPPSFRYPSEATPSNVAARAVGQDFFTLPATLEGPAKPLAGTYYDLNIAYHAHFGHFITEVPAKLWGWREAQRRFPGIRALIRVPVDYEPSYERELLAAYDIEDSDVVWAPGPVAVDSYVAATPMWQNKSPYWVHPAIAEVWRALRAGIEADDSGPDLLFVSRRPGMRHRDCSNAAEVENLFRDEGFTVVYPEEHSLTGQASLFRNARVVAGFGGSAMFNVLFSERMETMIVLNHDSYVARNEHLYAAVLGGTSHYFWSHISETDPGGHFDPVAFQAPWTFDMVAHRADLRELLQSCRDSAASSGSRHSDAS